MTPKYVQSYIYPYHQYYYTNNNWFGHFDDFSWQSVVMEEQEWPRLFSWVEETQQGSQRSSSSHGSFLCTFLFHSAHYPPLCIDLKENCKCSFLLSRRAEDSVFNAETG